MFRFFKRSAADVPTAPKAELSDNLVATAAESAVQPLAADAAPTASEPESTTIPSAAGILAAAPSADHVPAATAAPSSEGPSFFDPALAFAEAFEVVNAEKAAAELLHPASLREHLSASSESFRLKLGSLFDRNPKLDEDLLEEIETALLTADLGVTVTTDLVDGLRQRIKRRELADADALHASLRADLLALIEPLAKPMEIDLEAKPHVILVVGVNGAGKTTTIGKLAKHLKFSGASVMLGAGDTFRAAAVEQLKVWGERNDVMVVAQGTGADSASVIYDALQSAKARDIDVLLADTAGRLHTQTHLMNELIKVKRVMTKLDHTAPHEVLLVLDGTTGQNAINQARQFNEAMGVTGLVVTKLDGSAKGGMIFALAREFSLPIRYIGVGEKLEDLRAFDPADFVDALLPARPAPTAAE